MSKKKRGAVEVFFSKDFFNATVSMLSLFAVADENNKYSNYAERLKKKILTYCRIFNNGGEDWAVVYFYENEAAILIKLFSVYVSAVTESSQDFFQQAKNQKNNNR